MDRYLKGNRQFDDKLWNQDIERNKRLIAELWLFGVSYDFGIYSDRECWEICTHEQVYWYRDLLEKIIVQVSRMTADVDNLARTRPIVYSIRLQGQDAFLAMNLKLEDLEALYDESHVKGCLVQEVQKRYEQLQERLSPEKRVQVLGQPPGIDLTMENLDCFKQKLKYLGRIWDRGGQASIDMDLLDLRRICYTLEGRCNWQSTSEAI